MIKVLLPTLLCLVTSSSLAQDLPASDLTPVPARELKVLAPTLAPEQIDRAVLNRLLQEINDDSEAIADSLGIDRTQVQDIYVSLSNAHSFINDNQFANVRAMCDAYKGSDLSGEARIEEALTAYARRQQFTRDFIAKYYAVVIAGIEANLPPSALPKFNAYMNDRRRRMANAGAVVSGDVYQNARSGAETVQFHCRTDE